MNDLLGLINTSNFSVTPTDRLNKGALYWAPFTADTTNPLTGGLANMAPGSADRVARLQQAIEEDAINTNYAASWFLVRGGVKILMKNNYFLVSDVIPVAYLKIGDVVTMANITTWSSATAPNNRKAKHTPTSCAPSSAR